MSLLFLESCEVGFSRWITEGSMDHLSYDGLIDKKSFIIHDGTERFQNKIIKQFRDVTEHHEQRKFRLSFWMKTNRKLTKDSEFVSVFSKKENQGGMIGLDKSGRFYIGYLCQDNLWQGKYLDSNVDQPSVTDGKYHYVEFDIVWDNSPAAHIMVYVDNKLYLKRLGANLFDDRYCWSRPDSIMFGNLIGSDLFLDDIIMWDDIGTDYIGYKGPKRVQHSIPLGFQETQLSELKECLFETFIPNQARAGMVTAVVAENAGSMSNVSLVFKTESSKIKGSTHQIMKETDEALTFVIGPQNVSRTWIGIEKE